MSDVFADSVLWLKGHLTLGVITLLRQSPYIHKPDLTVRAALSEEVRVWSDLKLSKVGRRERTKMLIVRALVHHQ